MVHRVTEYPQAFREAFQAKLELIKQDEATATLPRGPYMRLRVQPVKPRSLPQVEFTEWARDSIVRPPSF